MRIFRFRLLTGKKPGYIESAKDLSIYILSKLDPKYRFMYQVGLTKVNLNSIKTNKI